jgi:hypothetical protein
MNPLSLSLFLSLCSKKLASKVQIQNVFLSTRSGLTRFFDFSNALPTKHRIQHRELTIDELIYKRTVEYSVKNHVEHFVFQIESEFDAFPASSTWVTIARAFFLQGHPDTNGKVKPATPDESGEVEHVPYMVSGMQITYNSFSELFFRHERNCDLVYCKIDCFRPDINCYLLDDNGYIVLSVNDFDSSRNLDNRLDKDAGRHLLELDYELFIHMTLSSKPIFRKVEVFDFQGICENPKEDSESASGRLSLSLFSTGWRLMTFVSELLLLAASRLTWSASPAAAWSEYEDEEEITGELNRTVVTACRKIYDLYELNYTEEFTTAPTKYSLNRKFDCDESYFLYKIDNSNLIMLISQNECQKVRHKREPRYPPEVEDCKDPEYMHRKRPHMYEDHMCSPNEEVSCIFKDNLFFINKLCFFVKIESFLICLF